MSLILISHHQQNWQFNPHPISENFLIICKRRIILTIMVYSTRVTLAAIGFLATGAFADFHVFLGTETYYGSPQTTQFFWMNTPPSW